MNRCRRPGCRREAERVYCSRSCSGKDAGEGNRGRLNRTLTREARAKGARMAHAECRRKYLERLRALVLTAAPGVADRVSPADLAAVTAAIYKHAWKVGYDRGRRAESRRRDALEAWRRQRAA